MSTVNCRNCNAPNPAGSKFCNNCGTALPPATKLICPSCKTPNPRSLLYCDNCGTRLVQQESQPPKPKQRPASQETAGEEPPAPSHRAFTLPAREPGDIGDLDIHKLPDWLRADWAGEEPPVAGIESAASTPVSEEDILGSWLNELEEVEDETAESEVEQPAWLTEAEPDATSFSGDDALPEWLTSAEMDQPAAPTEDTTADSYPDWLAETAIDEPAMATGTADADELPDWLVEAGLEQPSEAAENDLPDWFNQTAEEPLSSSAGTTADDETADWLSALGDDEPAAAPAEEPAGDFSSWLMPEETEAAGDDDDIFSEDLPDWLKDSPLSPSDSQLKGGTDELSQWLVDAIETPDTAEPAPLAAAEISPDDDAPDWLRDVQSVGTAAEAAIFGEEATLASATEESEAPDWLNAQLGLDEETAASIFTLADEEDSGAFPDWFSAAEPEVPAQAAAPTPEPEQPSPSDDLPDWIKEMAPRNTGLLDTGELAGGEEEAAEDNFDWLTELSPDAEASGGTGPLPEIGLPDALPDWLADLAPPDTGSLGRPRTGPLPPATPKAADKSDLEEPDWLADLRPADSGDDDETPPAAPRRRLPDVPVTELPSLRTDPPPPSSEMEGVPIELAAAELPEWLTTELGPPPGPGGPSIPVIRDVPDWLEPNDDDDEIAAAVLGPPPEGLTGAEWQDILSGLPPGGGAAAGGAVATDEADIPAWLQALRPRALGEGGQGQVAADEPALTSGPLAGLRGAIEIEAAAAQPREAKRPAPATISKDQQRQMALLHQLMHDSQRQAIPVDDRPKAAAPTWLRLVLALLLLLAVAAGPFVADLLPTAPTTLPPAGENFYNALSTRMGQPVLVVFDYSPAMAGELNPQAAMVVRQLRENGNTIYAVSQFVTGMGIVQQLEVDPPLESGTFIAGEAIGLRQLASCLVGDAVCLTESEAPLPNNVALIVLVTGERDSLTGWVEQVGSSTNMPIVAAVTQSVAPIAQAYIATEQIDGLISGLPAAAAYESQYRPGETELAAQLAGQTLALWLVIILLIIGNVWGWLYSLRPRSTKGGA